MRPAQHGDVIYPSLRRGDTVTNDCIQTNPFCFCELMNCDRFEVIAFLLMLNMPVEQKVIYPPMPVFVYHYGCVWG